MVRLDLIFLKKERKFSSKIFWQTTIFWGGHRDSTDEKFPFYHYYLFLNCMGGDSFKLNLGA